MGCRSRSRWRGRGCTRRWRKKVNEALVGGECVGVVGVGVGVVGGVPGVGGGVWGVGVGVGVEKEV